VDAAELVDGVIEPVAANQDVEQFGDGCEVLVAGAFDRLGPANTTGECLPQPDRLGNDISPDIFRDTILISTS